MNEKHNKVFACSDLHGRLDLFKIIQNFLSPEDTLYIIGDVIDRGPDGWSLLKEILKDKRCHLLMGNHEDLACKAISGMKYGDYEATQIWFYNGGTETYDAMLEDEHFWDIVPVLYNLIDTVTYTNKNGIDVVLNHSGFYQGKNHFKFKDDLLWDRDQYKYYFSHPWQYEDNVIVVHGHTPIPVMMHDLKKVKEFFKDDVNKTFVSFEDYDSGALWYANGHKVNLDTGAYWTGIATVLDLDTFDEHIFEGGKING